MSIQLRHYQNEALQSIQDNMLSCVFRQVVHLPTGSGKTVIFSLLIAHAIKENPSTRALILAFSSDLLGQAKDKLQMIAPGLSVGIVDMHRKEFDKSVVVSSVQSARQQGNLEKLKEQGFSIVICDECHHFASDSARLVLNELGFSKDGCSEGKRLLLGFTATPFRTDSRGLGEVFDKIVYHRSIKEMIGDGYLCKPMGHKIVTDLKLSQIAIENGDYSTLVLSRLMNTDTINETVVRTYMEKAGVGRKTIVFCTSIDHAEMLSLWFRKFGVQSEAIHSNLDTDERESLKKRFCDGEIEVLVNPTMLCEGYDEPSISCVIVARPTKSSGLYQQMVGRGLRLFPGKQECLILDFSDTSHSLCNVGILIGDDLSEGKEEKKPKNEKLEELVKGLPSSINKKLKKAIIELDLLGESFTWQKDFNGNYFLKSSSGDLKIIKRGEDLYEVVLLASEPMVLANGLNFEYAFSTAEDFARANRSLFSISDLNATWRGLAISEKQKALFSSYGFKNGINDLTRGQAASIISSGVLKRKSHSRSR